MYTSIAKVLYDYEINKRLADEEFVCRIIEIVSNYNNLSKYIKKIEVTNKESNKDSYYDSDGSIFINKNAVDVEVNAQSEYLKAVTGYDNRIMNHNLSVLETILHEMDHVYLEKEQDQDESKYNKFIEIATLAAGADIPSKNILIKLKNKFNDMYNKMIYDAYHDLAPFERRANIQSLRGIKHVINELKKSDLNVSSIYGSNYIYTNKLNGKEKEFYESNGIVTNSPSYDYLNSLSTTELISEMTDLYNANRIDSLESDSKEYSVKERLLYGLQLSDQEFKSIKNR
jgi:hypothetical protein